MPGTLHKELECEDYTEPKVNNESKQQKEQLKVLYETKLQSKVQCNSEDYKRAPTSFNDLKDYIINEFVASSKNQEKQENKKHQENSKCSIHEDVTKKEKKMKHSQ
ncbi:uncharacterized protein LOC122535125 isoform X2 [Frieseomelitta varia]|uniref:uncharacterized protein LOC122535125 isoform X2 n=1 Tax=Frieseomelitta varia TaxID=561572 RepID=UPI001CB67A85|nr:uncharacterized protein LOC122535125 isoform X2 [Frieseomelitta varia]